MTSLSHIEALLRERIGLDAASVGAGGVARALRERMNATGVNSHAGYWNLLHARADEFQALVESVVVPETWFFRHREALIAAGRFALERVLAAPTRAVPLRILSVPCSSGEEPYSIAMALLDAGVPPARFLVDAVDISERALTRARIAEYGPNAFRGPLLDFRDRHFSPHPFRAGHYLLHDRVRAQVRLHAGNVLDAAMLSDEPPYDCVFCRNLLIYFDRPTQRAVLARLDRLTQSGGMLFVGPAEASLLTREGYASAALPLAFAFLKDRQAPVARPGAAPVDAPMRTSATPRHAPPASGAVAHTRSAPVLGHVPRATAATTTRETAAAAARTVVAARSRRPGAPAPQPSPMAADPLAAARQLADRGDIRAAIAACERRIAQDGPSADALCLLGVLHDACGASELARDAYRRALYLDPTHGETLHHMAARLEAEGDGSAAARMRDRAARAARDAGRARGGTATPGLEPDHG